MTFSPASAPPGQQQLTLLQRAVLEWLRESGYAALADAASDAWSHGEACESVNMFSADEAELQAALDRANRHAKLRAL